MMNLLELGRFLAKCAGKVRYGRKETADAAVQAMLKKRGVELESYQCDYCEKWHIGHSIQPNLRDQMWERNPHCHWCGIETVRPPKGNMPKGEPDMRMATLDHLRSRRWSGNGKRTRDEQLASVLACYRCNFQRNNAEQKGRSIRVGDLVFHPDGTVEGSCGTTL